MFYFLIGLSDGRQEEHLSSPSQRHFRLASVVGGPPRYFRGLSYAWKRSAGSLLVHNVISRTNPAAVVLASSTAPAWGLGVGVKRTHHVGKHKSPGQ